MEEAAFRIDAERRRFLLVKWAQPDEIAPGTLEPHLRSDDLDQIGARSDLFDFILAETRHHRSISCASRSG
jgi:hypothetical protein